MGVESLLYIIIALLLIAITLLVVIVGKVSSGVSTILNAVASIDFECKYPEPDASDEETWGV